MRIVVVGTRGIPNILGGVETHCEELYPRLVKLGCEVILVRRSCYVTPDNLLSEYKGVKLHDLYAPRKKSIEAIIHTILAICYAKKISADILHIHAVGPSLLVPFARLLGLKVVMTHHGPDYDRKKWSKWAKRIIKIGEKMGVKYSNQVIVISNVINDILKKEYNRTDTHLIYNGVTTPQKSSQTDYIESIGLKTRKYVLALGRFVEEKGFDGLVRTFIKANIAGYKLVLAGDADHENEYSLNLKKLAKDNGVVLTGFIKGEKLNQILTNACLFVLPSSHEGLPISLLEAMSYGLDVLVSDIPANLELHLTNSDYFSCFDWDDLQVKLIKKITINDTLVQYNLLPYDWDYIAEQVNKVYQLI